MNKLCRISLQDRYIAQIFPTSESINEWFVIISPGYCSHGKFFSSQEKQERRGTISLSLLRSVTTSP